MTNQEFIIWLDGFLSCRTSIQWQDIISLKRKIQEIREPIDPLSSYREAKDSSGKHFTDNTLNTDNPDSLTKEVPKTWSVTSTNQQLRGKP